MSQTANRVCEDRSRSKLFLVRSPLFMRLDHGQHVAMTRLLPRLAQLRLVVPGPDQRTQFPPTGNGRGAVHDLGDQVAVDGVVRQLECILRTLAVRVVALDRRRTADANAVGAGIAQCVVGAQLC